MLRLDLFSIWLTNSEHAADWASATASFLAVLAAVSIAVHSSLREAAQQRESRRLRRDRACLALAHSAEVLILLRNKSLTDNTLMPKGFYASVFDYAALGVRDALSRDFESDELLNAALSLHASVISLRTLLDMLPGSSKITSWRGSLDVVGEQLLAARAGVRRAKNWPALPEVKDPSDKTPWPASPELETTLI